MNMIMNDLDNIDFEKLIGNRNISIVSFIEHVLKHSCLSEALYFYARCVIKDRWIEAESYITDDYWFKLYITFINNINLNYV